MRARIARSSALLAFLALPLISACGVQDQDQSDPNLITPPAIQKGIDTASDLPQSETDLLRNCFCYTTCSSNGRGWTSTYFVDIATSSAHCSTLAAGFCRAKARDYKYHNSACTL